VLPHQASAYRHETKQAPDATKTIKPTEKPPPFLPLILSQSKPQKKHDPSHSGTQKVRNYLKIEVMQ
jgi:hypothetical protein